MSHAEETARPRLVLVAPVYNEEHVVGAFLEQVLAVAPRLDLVGVVLVDDGSSDGTCAVVRSFQKRTGAALRLRLVRLSRNFGHQNAVLAGLGAAHAWARRENVPFVALMDADLQDRPEHLVDLARAMDAADVVYAVRASRGEGFAFRLLARAFHMALARLARLPIPQDAGTFSIMRTEVAQVVLDNADRAPYFPGIRAWVGFRQVGLPLDRDARHAGRSRVGLLGLVKLALGAMLGYSDMPLRLMALLGVVTVAVSTAAALTMIVLRLMGLVQVQGTALILVSIFFSLGVQSVYLMLLAYFIGRAAAESSRKRPFVVMSEDEVA